MTKTKLLLILTFLFILLKYVNLVSASNIVINEFLPHPSGGDDWIEIYNPTSNTINLAGWSIVDNNSTIKNLSGQISAGGFIVSEVSNRLNNSGDSITLKDNAGFLIDSYTYSSDPGIDRSLGRKPDGGTWNILNSFSKGSSNNDSSISPPSPSATFTPTPTPNSTASPESPNKFTISSIPSEINSFDSFSADINLEIPNNPNSVFYLKGAFQQEDSTNYFGQTLVNGSWIKNNKSYDSQYKITTDSQGKWSGSIQIKSDGDDSGYKGNGEYVFKVGRYSQSGSGPTWSNEIMLKISGSTQTNSPTPTPTQTPTTTNKLDSSEYKLLSTAKPSTKIVFSATNSSSVAGIATGSTQEEEVLVASESKINWWYIGGGIILLITGIVFIVKFLKQRGRFGNEYTNKF